MDSIKQHIEDRLWQVIKKNYISENFTNCILDAIQFLGDTLREKSGIDSDGVQLVGSALGGENPKIKLNGLTTETERNVQKGIESIFRGLFSAYRNPRSHSKINDTELDCFEVVIFLNHLLKIIDKSKGKFSVEEFSLRVFDNDFVETDEYADLLVKEIPEPKLFDIAHDLFTKKTTGNIHNIRRIWTRLYPKLNSTQKSDLLAIASNELRYTDTTFLIVRIIALFKSDWLQLAEDARHRAENKLLKSIPNAEISKHGQLSEEGAITTWIFSILSNSVFKFEISKSLSELFDSNEDHQRFAVKYVGPYLSEIMEETMFFYSLPDVFKSQIENGNKIIYDFVISKFKEDELDEYKDCISIYQSKNLIDDLPF